MNDSTYLFDNVKIDITINIFITLATSGKLLGVYKDFHYLSYFTTSGKELLMFTEQARDIISLP